MSTPISVSKTDLYKAFVAWEQWVRDGKTRSREERAAMPVEQVASESADHLWELLSQDQRTAVYVITPEERRMVLQAVLDAKVQNIHATPSAQDMVEAARQVFTEFPSF